MNEWIDEKPYDVYTTLCLRMKRSLMNHCFAYTTTSIVIFTKFQIRPKIIPIWILRLIKLKRKKNIFFPHIHAHFQIKPEKKKTQFDIWSIFNENFKKITCFSTSDKPEILTERLLTNHDHSHLHGMCMRPSAQERSSNFWNFNEKLFDFCDRWNVSKSNTQVQNDCTNMCEKPLVTSYSGALSIDWLTYSGFWFVFVWHG